MKWLEKWMGRSPPETPPATPRSPPGRGDLWDLDQPLVMLSPYDPWTIRHAAEGCCCFGSIGAGKSTGSMQTIGKSFLRHGFGGIILTSTPEEKDTWIEYTKATGRYDDLIIIEPGGAHPHQFNFMDYESRQGRRNEGAAAGEPIGLSENLVVLMTQINEITQGRSQQNSGEKFWDLAMSELLRASCDTLLLADGKVSLENVRKLIASAPLTEEQVTTDAWMYGFCGTKLWEARQNARTAQQNHDFEMAHRYFTVEYARLSPRTRSGISASVTGNIDLLQHGVAWHMLASETTITPDVTFKNGAILLLNTPVQEYFDVGKVIQGIWKFMFQRAVLRRNTTIYPRPVFLIADEYHYHVSSYDATFQSVARRARCCSLMLTQNISQLYAKLGHDEAHSLLGNYQTKLFHAQSDAATNEYAANLIAQHYQMAPSYSSTRNDGSTQATAGGSETTRYKVMPAQFTTLRKGGPPNLQVDAIMFQGGRIFHTTGDTWSPVTFDQRA